jgi:hypothetical protein
MWRTFCWRSADDLPRLRLAEASLTGEESDSSMWKLSKSGEDRDSLEADLYCSLPFANAEYGNFALRQVANRANLA